ncbi:hypothetical protein M3J09_006022 [Ascochyta lentis]
MSQAYDSQKDLLEPSSLLDLIYFHGTLSHLPAEALSPQTQAIILASVIAAIGTL